jgi:hypothetical protein
MSSVWQNANVVRTPFALRRMTTRAARREPARPAARSILSAIVPSTCLRPTCNPGPATTAPVQAPTWVLAFPFTKTARFAGYMLENDARTAESLAASQAGRSGTHRLSNYWIKCETPPTSEVGWPTPKPAPCAYAPPLPPAPDPNPAVADPARSWEARRPTHPTLPHPSCRSGERFL